MEVLEKIQLLLIAKLWESMGSDRTRDIQRLVEDTVADCRIITELWPNTGEVPALAKIANRSPLITLLASLSTAQTPSRGPEFPSHPESSQKCMFQHVGDKRRGISLKLSPTVAAYGAKMTIFDEGALNSRWTVSDHSSAS